MIDPTAELLAAMASVGLRPKQIQWDATTDSSPHRFPGIGQEGRGDNGWYKAFIDQRGALFGDWRTHEMWKWPKDFPEHKERLKSLKPLSAAEVRKKEAAAAKRRARDQKKADEKVKVMWENAAPTRTHPYLEARGIRNTKHLRITIDPQTNQPMLLIPMADESGEVVSLQRIWPDGTRKQTWRPIGSVGLYHVIGAESFKQKTDTLYLCEGWATGWTINQAIGCAVIVCFFDGGLKTIGEMMKRKYPQAKFIVCADNDRWTKVKRKGKKKKVPNPGVLAARDTAKAIGAKVCIPEFHDLSDVPPGEKGPTDFDDLRQREGLDAVKRWLDPKMAGKAVTVDSSLEEPEPEDEPEDEPEPEPEDEPEPEPEDEPQAYTPRRKMKDLQMRYRTDPVALAHRLLDRLARQILIVVQADQDTTAYMALPTGLWTISPEPWRREITRELTAMITEIRRALVKNKISLPVANRRTNRIHGVLKHIDKTVAAVRTSTATAWHLYMEPLSDVESFDWPREVHKRELDADLNVLGFENGVVCLRTGRLLDEVAGADRFVTKTTGIEFSPEKAGDADRLFEHLDEDLRAFWVEALAWMLRGRPSRRIWLVVGEANSGKTTVATAVQAALGEDYAKGLQSDALQKQRGDTARRGLSAFGCPCRAVLIEEPTVGHLDTSLLKNLSGGGHITVRRLYKDPFTVAATGSLVIFANPGTSVPHLGLADPALADRVRELPYPEVPEEWRDPQFLETTVLSLDFREALAARLVLAGTKLSGRPSSPHAVKQATQRRLELDLLPIEVFARRLVPGQADDFLETSEVWAKWCEFQADRVPDDTTSKVGGFTRVTLNMNLNKRVPNLPKSKRTRFGAVRKSGWPGWRLIESSE